MDYRMSIGGIERDLLLCPISDELMIAALKLHGDVELTERCAEELCKIAPPHDVIITAESKGIPLAYAMCRMLSEKRYVLARKSVKLYMSNVMKCETQSITTKNAQVLYLDGPDVEYIKGKRVLIVDDVVSTGGSLASLEELIVQAGATVVGKMAIIAEGDAIARPDITYLATLPLFDKNGKPLD